MPIFKRGSAFLANNYRGVHLVPVLAKVVERVLGMPLMPFLERTTFGTNQWAYRKRHSAKDLAFLCISRWILQICTGHKVGVYLSDISGAFDRV